MITLLTGVPGTGKTAALVSILLKLGEHRPLYVYGLDGLKLDHLAVDPHDWMSEVPDGGIVVIDEVQDVWRPRGSGAAVPDAVKALEVHRHRGIDFFLTTQKPHLVDANVRALVGRHIHLRDLGLLGRRWVEFDECCWPISPKKAYVNKRWTLPKEAFAHYTSASIHSKVPRSIPPMMFVLVGCALVLALLGWRIVSNMAGKGGGSVPAASVAAAPQGSAPGARKLPPPRQTAAQLVRERLPVVADDPRTAPIYDGLRRVVRMPRIMGGFCAANLGCRCYLQDGVYAAISGSACEAWIRNPPFDPFYLPASPGQSSTNVQPAAPPPARPASAPTA